MDKLRADFEEWLCKTYDWGNDTLNMADFYGDDKTGNYVDGHFLVDGESCSDCLFWAWEGWKANRASIVVELPNYDSYHDQGSAMAAIDDCSKAIRSIGLSIKGDQV